MESFTIEMLETLEQGFSELARGAKKLKSVIHSLKNQAKSFNDTEEEMIEVEQTILDVSMYAEAAEYLETKQKINLSSQRRFIERLLSKSVRQDRSKNTWMYFNTTLPRDKKNAWKKMTEAQLSGLYDAISEAWYEYQTFFEGRKPENIHSNAWERRHACILNIEFPVDMYKCKPFVTAIRDLHCSLPKLK